MINILISYKQLEDTEYINNKPLQEKIVIKSAMDKKVLIFFNKKEALIVIMAFQIITVSVNG